jgi:hypothetical protein
MAKNRPNVIPIIEDARHPQKYRMLVPMVDAVFADVAQPDQVSHITAHKFVTASVVIRHMQWRKAVAWQLITCGIHTGLDLLRLQNGQQVAALIIELKTTFSERALNLPYPFSPVSAEVYPVPCCNISASMQARIVGLNAQYFLKNGGFYVISIKASCIDSTAQPEAVFAREVKKLSEMQLKPKEQVTLEPYERDHAMVVGVYRPPPKAKAAA